MFNFYKKLNSKFDANLYLLVVILLALVLCYLQPLFIPIAVAVVAGTYYFRKQSLDNKKVFLDSYLDNIVRNIERTNHFAVSKMEIGMAVFSKEGRLQWKNDTFQKYVKCEDLEGKKPEEILPLQDNAYEVLSVRDGEQIIKLHNHFYKMKYASVQTQENVNKLSDEDTSSGLMIYLMDADETEQLRQRLENEKICLAYICIDNYDEVTRGMSETNIANLNGVINERLTEWVASHKGFICRMNKERSLLGFTQSAVMKMMENKFLILDQIRGIRAGNKFVPTFSIGVTCDGDTLEEKLKNAAKCLDMVLSRGGDQAVVLKDKKSEFFGGMSNVGAKNTRVRARVVAQKLREQMEAADRIFVMGHVNEDYDAIGATIGVAKMGLSLGKETYIVPSKENEYYKREVDALQYGDIIISEQDKRYFEKMLSEQDALNLVTPQSLLILVDHHLAVLTASKELLGAIKKRVIIDHHRRAENIIEDVELLYLEPSSSSASELVTEIVWYFKEEMDFSPAEATMLFAGMVLDTKNFATQTSERTFEAAARLRSNGASPAIIRQLFKDEVGLVQARAKLVAEARTPLEGLALTVLRNAPMETRSNTLAAQTADSLIMMEGVAAGMAMVEYKDGSLGISARSDGSVNVQIIMEALGGGGHQNGAATRIPQAKAKDVEPQIIELVKKQLEERENNESNSVARC